MQNKVISAEEFARSEYADYRDSELFMERQIDMKHAIFMMTEFAKLHIAAALASAADNAQIRVDIQSGYTGDRVEYLKQVNYHDNCGGSRYYSDNVAVVDKDSILTSYDLENLT